MVDPPAASSSSFTGFMRRVFEAPDLSAIESLARETKRLPIEGDLSRVHVELAKYLVAIRHGRQQDMNAFSPRTGTPRRGNSSLSIGGTSPFGFRPRHASNEHDEFERPHSRDRSIPSLGTLQRNKAATHGRKSSVFPGTAGAGAMHLMNDFKTDELDYDSNEYRHNNLENISTVPELWADKDGDGGVRDLPLVLDVNGPPASAPSIMHDGHMGAPTVAVDPNSAVPARIRSARPGGSQAGSRLVNISIQSSPGHANAVGQVAFASLLEDLVVSCGVDEPIGFLRPLHIVAKVPMATYVAQSSSITHLCISSDVSLVAISEEDGTTAVYNMATLRCTGVLPHQTRVTCAVFSPNGRYVLTGSQDGCRLWHARDRRQPSAMCVYHGHRDPITCIAIQPQGDLAASGCTAGAVHIWNSVTVRQHTQLKLHTSAILSLSFNDKGTVLLSVDAHKAVLTDVITGATLHVFNAAKPVVHIEAPIVGADVSSNTDPEHSRPFLHSSVGLAPAVAIGPIPFTYGFFAPHMHFPNHVFLCRGDGTVSLMEFKLSYYGRRSSLSGRSTTDAQNIAGAGRSFTGGAAGGGQQQQRKREVTMQSDNNSQGDGGRPTVQVFPELWSMKLKGSVCCASAGPQKRVVLGDTMGNVTILSMRPRVVETMPPPRIRPRFMVKLMNPMGE